MDRSGAEGAEVETRGRSPGLNPRRHPMGTSRAEHGGRRAPAVPGALASIVDRAGLADDGHLDLAGVFEAFLDLLRDVAGEAGGAEVVDGARGDENADLPAGLDGEALLDAVEGVGDAFERLEALDVG